MEKAEGEMRDSYKQGREDAIAECLAHVAQIKERSHNPAASCDGEVQMVVGGIELRLQRLLQGSLSKAEAAVTSELADLDDLDRNNLHVNDVRAMLERILAEITT